MVSSSSWVEAIRQTAVLVGLTLLLWVMLVGPAWLLSNLNGVIGLSVAAFVCCVPGCVAFGLKALFKPSPNGFFLLSTGLRFGFVIAVTLLVKQERPELGLRQFHVWLIFFYLAALAVETWLVLRRPT